MLNDLQSHPNKKELDDALVELAGLRNLVDITLRCPYVEAALFDILNNAAALILEHGWSSELLITLFNKESEPTGRLRSAHGSYLERRLLLFQVYTLLLTKTSMASRSTELRVHHDLLSNPESLRYALEILRQKQFWPNIPHGVLFLVQLMRGIQEEDSMPPDIVANATRCLVDALDQFNKPSLPDLYSILGKVDLSKSTTREGTNAAMRLEAYRLFTATPTLEVRNEFNTQFLRWATMVEFASMDLIDFPTRWSAARALSIYFRLIGQQQPDKTQPIQGPLRAKVTLYNLLNDDDEDVRAEAALAAANLLQHDQRQRALGLSPIAARELLLTRLIQEYGKTVELAECAVIRIMLLRQNITGRSDMPSLANVCAVPVQSKIHRLLRAKDDLFAEESQNLYIDDIQETKAWNGVLRHCIDQLTPEQVDLIVRWTLEGFSAVLDTIRDNMIGCMLEGHSENGGEQTDQDSQQTRIRKVTVHPLGPTYDADLLVVFAQVISIASSIRSRASDIVQEQILDHLRETKQLCRDGQVSEVLLF